MRNRNRFPGSQPSSQSIKPKKLGNPVSKMTQVAGKRIGGALRSEYARQQKRRDTRR
ncbi:MAG TPA: hypothetical protein VF794_22845 [Archangium sp.]|jgi:hypothetical protein|uniref:hypothetical protein n=1 Tax=Archangium sp. TaxID=1872627 RepID=UPI002EDA7789